MKTNLLLALSSMLLASTAMAQNIDFDLPGKTTPGKDTELNYISWAVPRATSDTKTFDNGVTITISAGGAASAVGSNWNKTDVETNGLRVTQPYATIAGQTAPGKGICIKSSNINIGSDVIARHVRFKRGLGVYGENTGNAMGMSGADHAIVDHCTAAWGTDETVSGRGAQNISFQYSVISEALGIAGHKNYEDGKNHGFAATIDGRIGSWHHNLLVNCNGRNWSMGGGMDGQNRPIGGLDIFNNVCYNWNGRTTDGNCHAVNFVNNYYKMGADTKRTELFIMQFELPTDVADNRTNTGYVSGNIRENKNHTLSYDKRGDTYTATGYVPTDYEYLVNEPLFPSYAEIHTAKDAMKIVTSYAGVTMPMRDEQHVRNVRETLDGTWTYKGSKSNIKGEIDNEADITDAANGGWEEWPEEYRTADWDRTKPSVRKPKSSRLSTRK